MQIYLTQGLSGRTACLADLLVHTDALGSGLDLLTRNRSDFERVDGLRLADLSE